MIEENKEQLTNESIILHRLLFNSEIPSEISNKYLDAHFYYIKNTNRQEYIWLKIILHLNLDIEAIEIALRFINPNHILIRKLKLLTYITESYNTYYNEFVNEQPQRLKAFLTIFYHTIRSFYKFIKGMLLIIRYRKFGKNYV